ncbi:MAG: hypothetical protein AAGB00_09070 [Planctomycetota bacterium]
MIHPPHVVKIGGSLLARPGAAEALAGWLLRDRSRGAPAHQVLIVGGGEPVQWLRRLDYQQPLGDAAAHAAAVVMMDANSRAVAGWWPEAAWTDDWKQLTTTGRAAAFTLFAPGRWLREIEPSLPGARLPIGWHVTSDSIAARIAALLGGRLTLLKSRPFARATDGDWQGLVDEGGVDGFFPQIVTEVAEARIACPFC